MSVYEKIRKLRETKQWSQEQMAERMGMSLNGYAKIERGETKLHLDKLEQIAQILDMDVVELITHGEKSLCFQINENTHLSSLYYGNNENLTIEIEKLKLSLSYSQQLLDQKDNEIKALREMVELLKKNQ